MKLVNFTCPGCGAQLNVDASMKRATCQYCGMSFPVDDEAQHVKFDGAEQAGYEFEKGRQRAQQEQMRQTVYAQVPPAQPKPKRKTWLWVLGWIFLFPVPLTIIMLKNESVKQSLNPKVRYAIIAVAWLLYLAIGLSGGSGGNSENSKTTETSSTIAATQLSGDSSSVSAKATETEKASQPVELDELQKAFCSLNDATTRADIDALIEENAFEVTRFTGDSGYYIGYEYQAVTERGRDRQGEALDVNFNNDGILKSAEYAVHTGLSTHTALKYESGSFFYEGNKVDSAESAMQHYLASLPPQSTRASSANV